MPSCILSSSDRMCATCYLHVHSLLLLSEDAVVGILQWSGRHLDVMKSLSMMGVFLRLIYGSQVAS